MRAQMEEAVSEMSYLWSYYLALRIVILMLGIGTLRIRNLETKPLRSRSERPRWMMITMDEVQWQSGGSNGEKCG